MNYSHLKSRYKSSEAQRLAWLVVLSFLTCIIFSTHVWAQVERPATISPFKSNQLIIGVRTAAYDVGRDVDENFSSGFCGSFGEGLQDELSDRNIQVTYLPIENNYLGNEWERYDGLRDNIIHVECGPNSRPSNNPKWARGIRFSDMPFHQTGIKLLIKESFLNGIKGNKKIADIAKVTTIVVDKSTTTFTVLDSFSDFKVIGTGSRDDALDKLDKYEDYSYASDALIINHLLKKGAEKFVSATGEVLMEERAPYKDNGYTIFPNDGTYLAGKSEDYVIAIKDGTPYSDELMEAVERTIKSDFIKEESAKLEQAEVIRSIDSGRDSFFRLPDGFQWIIGIIIGVVLLLLFALGFLLRAFSKPNKTVIGNAPESPQETSRNSVHVTVSPIITSSSDSQATAAGERALAYRYRQEFEGIGNEIRQLLESIKNSSISEKVAENKAYNLGSELDSENPQIYRKILKALEVASIETIKQFIKHPLATFFVKGFEEIRR